MRTTEKYWPWWRWILVVLNTLALVLSAIMSWHYLAGGPMIGCGGGSPCEQVLSSQWSKIAGILPVSGLAVGVYLSMLVAGIFIGPATEVPIRRLAWSMMLVLAGSVAGSAIWFTIVQKWIIGDFCTFCMITHITGMLLAVLIIRRAVKYLTGQNIRPLAVLFRFLAGLVLSGLLVISQVILTSGTVYIDGESDKSVTAIDYNNVPVIGPPDATYVVSLLFDYQCAHCQKLHFMLDEAVNSYSGKLAFALCPSPLNTQCNPYIPEDADQFRNSCELTKIGLAVWLTGRFFLNSKTGCSPLNPVTGGCQEVLKPPGQKQLSWWARINSIVYWKIPGSIRIYRLPPEFTDRPCRTEWVEYPNWYSVHDGLSRSPTVLRTW